MEHHEYTRPGEAHEAASDQSRRATCGKSVGFGPVGAGAGLVLSRTGEKWPQLLAAPGSQGRGGPPAHDRAVHV